MEGYKTSAGYNFQKDELQKSMGAASAAGGYRGTPLDQNNQGEQIQGLLSKDQQQWLQNVLGRYDTGLQGEAGEATQGYNASGSLADILGNNLNQQGGMAYGQAQQGNKTRTDMIQTLIKALSSAAGAFGGPIGGALGGALGGAIAGPLSGSSTAPWANPG
jgi:hypothetical protein